MGTGNLIFQFLILGMLMMSIHYKKKADFSGHGKMLAIAWITNFLSFALVMSTGFIYFYVSEPQSLSYKLSIVHGLVGGIAMILGLWILVSWLMHSDDIKNCARNRIPMRATYILWVTALILGIGVWILDVVLGI